MEVAKPEASSSPSTTEAETYRRKDDPIVIPAHAFNPIPKVTIEADFQDLKNYLLTPEVSPFPVQDNLGMLSCAVCPQSKGEVITTQI